MDSSNTENCNVLIRLSETKFDGNEGSLNRFNVTGKCEHDKLFRRNEQQDPAGPAVAAPRLCDRHWLLEDRQGLQEVQEQYNSYENINNPMSQVGFGCCCTTETLPVREPTGPTLAAPR